MGPHSAKNCPPCLHKNRTLACVYYTPHIQVGNHKIQLRASRANVYTQSVLTLCHMVSVTAISASMWLKLLFWMIVWNWRWRQSTKHPDSFESKTHPCEQNTTNVICHMHEVCQERFDRAVPSTRTHIILVSQKHLYATSDFTHIWAKTTKQAEIKSF